MDGHIRPNESWLLRAAVEACPFGVVVSDLRAPDAPLVFVNRAFTEITGYAPDEALGRNCRFLQCPESKPDVVAAMREAIAARRSGTFEVTNRRKNGEHFLSRVELEPLADPVTGEITAFVGLQRDITEFRAADQRRQESEKLEALGRTASGFAHEVNNLLQPVLSFGELLRERVVESGDAEAVEEAELLLDSARAASQVARRVLCVARGGGGSATPRPVAELVRHTAAAAARGLPAGVRVLLPADGPRGIVSVEPTELLQALTNLFVNAADAMAGRGEIRVSFASPEGGFAGIEVADTGPGLDAATAARAFEPFFTTKPVGQGTGLGLALVWSLATGWGGTVSLAPSAPGEGARFVLTLPLLPPLPPEESR